MVSPGIMESIFKASCLKPCPSTFVYGNTPRFSVEPLHSAESCHWLYQAVWLCHMGHMLLCHCGLSLYSAGTAQAEAAFDLGGAAPPSTQIR